METKEGGITDHNPFSENDRRSGISVRGNGKDCSKDIWNWGNNNNRRTGDETNIGNIELQFTVRAYVFIQKVFIGQDILIWIGLGIFYGIIGVLLAVLPRKTDIKPIFLIPIVLISIFGVPVIFGLQYFGSFIISFVSGVIFAYSVSHNLRNSILFIFSSLLLIFSIATKTIPDKFFFYNLIIYIALSAIIGIVAVIFGIFLLQTYLYLKNQLR